MDVVVARSKWFTIHQANAIDEFIACPDEVIIVARDEDGRILLIEEPSYAFGGTTLLFPGGVVEPGEELLATAQRELREETGFGARRMERVGVLRPWSKYLRVSCHVVYGEALASAPLAGDEVHPIRLHRKTYAELRQMISSGEIADARVIAAVLTCFDTDGGRAAPSATGGDL
jgi:8-oxo-dGTP pyrophosphatase MutT (NUDIX family)